MTCSSISCFNDVKGTRKFCGTCYSRRWRERYPVKAAFNTLRYNAKRRNIFFGLSFDFFKKFCKRTAYIQLKGPGPNDMTIDRIIPELGYIDGNIQMITRIANTIKQRKDEKVWSVVITKDNCPF